MASNAPPLDACPATLHERYHAIRARSVALCEPLAPEDHVPQPAEFVSPPKWHLAHTSWFFETFILQGMRQGHRPWHPDWGFLFNSYYESVGQRVPRPQRGALSRPTVAEILAYRRHVDELMQSLLKDEMDPAWRALIELGLQHEQQHQELLVTDTKYILGHNPLRPAYSLTPMQDLDPALEHAALVRGRDAWHAHEGGNVEVGHQGAGFCFDNELGRHTQHLRPFQISGQLVSNREYMAFMADGGYAHFGFWHADGWDWVRQHAIEAPMYWFRHPDHAGAWWHYTLRGPEPVPPDAPVTHIAYYEAFAYAQWAARQWPGCRLPTEFEWEAAALALDTGRRWEWTESAYKPYPGFSKMPGAPGEYNGKFMVNQQVLRGASFATPPGHARLTYRNFFQPDMRWQYTGIRLARDL